MRWRRSALYVIQRFSTATSPLARPLQSMRPPSNSEARSWKLRTARDSESLKRSKRANGDATGAAVGGGAAGCEAGAAGGGAEGLVAGRRGGGAGRRPGG